MEEQEIEREKREDEEHVFDLLKLRPLNSKHRWEDESVLRKECHTLDSIRQGIANAIFVRITTRKFDKKGIYGKKESFFENFPALIWSLTQNDSASHVVEELSNFMSFFSKISLVLKNFSGLNPEKFSGDKIFSVNMYPSH
ncbi:hypothetical protein HYC85_028484 [Camellia sinensis]|uniref:Uncharacterized protein n=1 Tax=Camellia sinensis TaxID=4442 RepID=A0A7J7FVA8_CAMSI|nr:hypothetical protein HYC85_028484 [Camellia sinensis]